MAMLLGMMTTFDSAGQDIFSAVAEGNVLLCKQLLDKEPGLLNLKNSDLLTPLNLAAERGQTEVAELLLNLGADPTFGDNENSQPIHLAAVNGHIPVVDLLLEDGVDIDARDDNQMTPLLFAASRGQTDMCRFLVEKGADVKAKNLTGFTALLMASISGNPDLVKMFTDKGANVNTKNFTGYTALHSAASYGRTDVVKYLVDKGADIHAETDEGAQPLALAVGRNSYDAAQYLISKGAEVNHKEMNGFTALHNAAGRGNAAVARLLIENGANVNAAANDGLVPLTYAAWADNAGEMGRLLILHGADVNPDPCKENKECACGPNFRTPLHAACSAGKLDLIEMLVDNGARINLYDNNGLTPLHWAVKSGQAEAVSYLLDHGAFLNVKDTRMGCTELHLAAMLGYGDIAAVLEEKGSCPEVKDNAGKTPLDYSFYYGQDQIGYGMMAAGASDSNLAAFINEKCLLSKQYALGEAEVWFLGHSGWAVKTRDHFLVFDYFDNPRERKPDHTCLKSGSIVPEELNGQNIEVFSTHGHQDHFNKSYFDWNDNIPGVSYIFCHHPAGITEEYRYLPVNSETEIDGMKIYINKSTDGGGGFLVEVDGLTIFHMGDHANGDDELSEEFTREIDLIAAMNKDIDLLFGPIRGCSLGTPPQVKTGIYYTLEKLQPELYVPMHCGSFSSEYKSFVDQAQRDVLKQPMKYMNARGDRFHYFKGEEVVRN